MLPHPLAPAGIDDEKLREWNTYFSLGWDLHLTQQDIQKQRDVGRQVSHKELQDIREMQKELAVRKAAIRSRLKEVLEKKTDVDLEEGEGQWIGPSEQEETLEDLFDEEAEEVSDFISEMNAVNYAVKKQLPGRLRQSLRLFVGLPIGHPRVLPESVASHSRMRVLVERHLLSKNLRAAMG